MKVAVIIPTLNEEKFIGKCLDSVIVQSYPFREMDVMVVDGGSKDRTREIVNEYHNKYSNIRLLDNSGRIQSIAFNIGVQNSAAPYIVRLDAHAIYNKVYIEKCIKNFSADAEILSCAPGSVGNVGGVWDIRPQHSGLIAESSAILNRSRFGIGGAAFRVGAPAGFVDTVPFGCFPRMVLNHVGGMREDLPRGEDNEFNSRLRKAGYKIYLDPEIVCTYFSRDTLKANMKQMYANGESVGHLLYVDRESVGLRHLVPLFFVTGIIGGVILSFIWFPVFCILVAGLGLYILCDFVASCLAAKEHGWKYFLPLFLMFFCVHISYGWGTIVGLFTGRKLKK
ncbi:MAG: glycosyltransferase family 2 protein [Prevotella sp.]|nr:glycosyltransferase family 2 protein [Prevotella sp.]